MTNYFYRRPPKDIRTDPNQWWWWPDFFIRPVPLVLIAGFAFMVAIGLMLREVALIRNELILHAPSQKGREQNSQISATAAAPEEAVPAAASETG